MAYTPPGVEITQVTKTVSPPFTTPTLIPAVTGPAYQVYHIKTDTSPAFSTYYSGVSLTIPASSFPNWQSNAGWALDKDAVYVDLVLPGRSVTSNSQAIGTRVSYTSYSGLSVSASQVVIPASAGGSVSGMMGADIYIGYRALRTDLLTSTLYESVEQVVSRFPDVGTLNPLGFALATTINNATSAVYGCPVTQDAFPLTPIGSGTASSAHATAIADLANYEMYAIAPITTDETIISSYKTHVDSLSLPTEKRERILFAAPKITWGASKAETANSYAAKSGAVLDRRVFYVFPDATYVLEYRHVSTLSPSYVYNLYKNGMSQQYKARLADRVKFTSSNSEVVWRGFDLNPLAGVGEEITESLYNALVSHGQTWYWAYVPVPASVSLSPAVAGQVAKFQPQVPLTNQDIVGVNQVRGSSDYFSESNLNTIAAGGTYIMIQRRAGDPIVCRHQLSTDMSTVERRELSITKTVDYTAKFVRTAVYPYIGKYVISPATLTMLNATFNGVGDVLKRDKVLADFKVLALEQDLVNKDTVTASISLLPSYPVNYIKVDLIF